MTRDELIAFFDASAAEMRQLMLDKNHDYAGVVNEHVNCFANFTCVEALTVATTSQGFMVRMLDKYMRINSLTTQIAAVKTESIRDTLLDLANYSILFAAWLSTQKKSESV